MPLKKVPANANKKTKNKVVSENIRELENSKTAAGKKRTHEQNVAIALSEARKNKKKK